MSEDINKTGNNGQENPNRPKMIKVKRLKPKNPNAPRPAYPSSAQPQAERQPVQQNLTVSNGISDFIPDDPFANRNSITNSPQYVEPQYDPADDYDTDNAVMHMLHAQPVKVIVLASMLFFAFGFGIAKMLSPAETAVREGLQGVVVNPEVPRRRARCGLVDKTQGCVLYIMNPQRQDLNARDFYDLASQLTGRQRFVIDTGNMRYSNVKIKPGAIAQINIPPLQ